MRGGRRGRQEENFHNWQLITGLHFYTSLMFLFQVLILIVSAAEIWCWIRQIIWSSIPLWLYSRSRLSHSELLWSLLSADPGSIEECQAQLRPAEARPGQRDVTHRDRNWWKIVLARKNIINWSSLCSWLLAFISIQTRSLLDQTQRYPALVFTATADSILKVQTGDKSTDRNTIKFQKRHISVIFCQCSSPFQPKKCQSKLRSCVTRLIYGWRNHNDRGLVTIRTKTDPLQ